MANQVFGKALSDIPALKPYRGKLAVRNFRGGDGNVGIIRSPVRAIALPDRYTLGARYSLAGEKDMLTRRRVIQDLSFLAVAGQFAGESLLARRLNADTPSHGEMVWLDANENPAGPPTSAIKAIVDGVAATARYHFDEFDGFAQAIARSEDLRPDQVLFGVGSTEIIDAAICAFTSATAPLITAAPSYDIPMDLAR